MARKLSVFLNEDYVGELVQDDSGQMFFAYAENWLESSRAMPLSHSLPLQKERFKRDACRGFFSGVLPEDRIRETVARILGISARNDFAMLEQIGGECAGAVTFLPVGQTSLEVEYKYRALSDSELADILRTLPQHPLLAGDEGVRLSLAGAQDKLAVMVKDDKTFIPLGSAPSSHILKPAIERFKGLVYNEALCLQIAAAVGIPSVKSVIHTLEGIDYLLVERYDRAIGKDGSMRRVHQEDFCQALGIVSEMKYQNEGGPSLKQCFDLVRTMSSAPVLDLKTLLDAVIFNFIIGNHDAHGKNFSLLYSGREIRLAPLYDVVCTVYYPELSFKMAMKIGKRYKSNEVRPRDFDLLAEEIGFAVPMVRGRVTQMVDEVADVVYAMETSNEVSKEVKKIISDRCTKIKRLFG